VTEIGIGFVVVVIVRLFRIAIIHKGWQITGRRDRRPWVSSVS
jgi:hypothetical protein